jgi:hypothetical protein
MRAIPIPPWVRGALALALLSPAALAGEADVLSAEAQCSDDRVCRFVVTLHHADEGWKHYADRWEVLSPEGELLATRVLRHPHVEEQPCTRALPGVKIPISVEKVRIRARDSVHGYGGEEVESELPR